MDSLYIVMPAYNEEANIEEVVKQWSALLTGKGENSKIVIADAGSSDNTHTILENLKKEISQLEVISDSDKFHGPKVIALYAYAIKNGADYIFQTDSDGQTNPAEFNAFWEKRAENKAVIGYRTVRGDGKDRAFVEKVVCFLLKLYFGVNVPDANAPFRLMSTKLVDKYLSRLPSDYNLPNIMMTTYFAYYKEKLEFVEISFKPRQGGKNTMNIPKIVKIGWKALGDFRKLKSEM